MASVGIIAEYNPFHNGHLYQIQEIKKKYPEDTIVIAMSGNFTQRGEPAIIDKWTRANLAILAGADLVVEIPYHFATQSADYFSYAGITLLEKLKVEKLVFGSESNNIDDITEIAKAELENEDFDKLVKIYSKFGYNYPTALSLALKDLTGKKIDTPNDILGITYIKTILKYNYNMKPESIKRTNDYNSKELSGTINSATSIRENIEDLEKITKENLYTYYNHIIKHDFVDIFVLGDVDEEEITNVIRNKFKINTYKKQPIKALVTPLKITKSKIVKENIKAEQDNLVITLNLNNLTDYERNYPLSLYNAILGGGTESLLFSEVREKNSLAYTISSSPNKLDNLIIIRGGITKGKSMEAVNIIKKILKDLASGKIDDDKVNKAKEYYTSAIDDIIESPFQIIESYYMIELLGVDDIETKRKKMLKVTKDEIISVAKKIKINTVYILEGSDNNGEN